MVTSGGRDMMDVSFQRVPLPSDSSENDDKVIIYRRNLHSCGRGRLHEPNEAAFYIWGAESSEARLS